MSLHELIHDFKHHLKDHYDEDTLVEGKRVEITRPKAFVPPPLPPQPAPPPPTKTVAVKPPPVPKTFDKEKVEYESVSQFNEVKLFYQLHAPNISIKAIPDEIKKGIEVKRGVVLLLAFSSHHLSFLKNVSVAIENKFNLPCTVELVDDKYIWKERGFKKVIASGYGVDGYFKSHLKEEGCLGQTPLMALPDLTQYFNEPHLKKSLWIELCQELRKLSST